MKKTMWMGMVFWGLAASILMVGNVFAAEVLLQDVIEKNIKVEEVFEKVTDNFVVLFDASGSMAQPYKDTGMAKVDIAKKLLGDRGQQLPDLGYNAGLYTFTPWKTYYEMQPYDEAKMASGRRSTADDRFGHPSHPPGARHPEPGSHFGRRFGQNDGLYLLRRHLHLQAENQSSKCRQGAGPETRRRLLSDQLGPDRQAKQTAERYRRDQPRLSGGQL